MSNIIIILSIIEIFVLIVVFTWICILLKLGKSLKFARVILIMVIIIIVGSQAGMHLNINNNTTKEAWVEEQQSTEKKDTTPPTITLVGNEEIKVQKGQQYQEPGYSATDDVDGEMTDKVKVEYTKNNEKEYEVSYTATDSSGNTAKSKRKVTVVEPLNKNGVIYLTFDDGPSLDITPGILDKLKKNNVKATFFVLNYSENKENLIKRIVNEGHTIAIHGYSHEYSKIYKSDEGFMNNVYSLQEKIKKTTGVTTKYVRFPGGSSNTISKKYSPGIMTRLTERLVKEGYSYFDWNISCEDAAGAKNSTEIYNNVVKYLSKSRSNVVLMHDFTNNNKTLDALDDIIKYGKENGYTFESIDENTPECRHHVNN